MLTYIFATAIPVAFFAGFYLRELLEVIKRIETRLQYLKLGQDKATEPKARATFAEPMSRAEIAAMIEEERINVLNQ